MVKCRIATYPFLCVVDGKTEILIVDSNCKTMSNHETCVHYFTGEAKCGGEINELPGIKATVLCFEGDVAKITHDRLKCLSHPYVLRSLGYGGGLGNYSRFSFLALPFFDATLAEYLPNKLGFSVQMDRFTVEFIDLVGQIVRAMITLHDGGFCCGHLKGESIAIVKQHNSLCAKIWNFQKCTSDGDEDLDWIRLGMLLQETRLRTTEAQDLYTSLLSGRLKGMDILDHSSLLTVRKKFDNVLLFDFYTKTHWTKEYTQAHDSTEAVSTVKGVQAPEWLDEEFNWRSHRPSWIFARCLTDPPNTYRGFSQFIRHLIQHEVDFLSPQLINEISWQDREKGEKEVDLEWHIRKAWHKAFLKLQNFVRTAKLSTTSGYISASGSKDDTIPVH